MKTLLRFAFAVSFMALMSTTVYGQQPPPLNDCDCEKDGDLTLTQEYDTSSEEVQGMTYVATMTLSVTDRKLLGIKE